MDYWSYLPFVQFIRNDKETVSIMAEAMQIIPTVCKILQGPQSRTNSASSTSGGDSTPSTPNAGQVLSSNAPLASSSSLPNLTLQEMAAASSLVTLSRKRKRPEEPSSSAMMYPLKKRKIVGTGTSGDNPRDCNQPGTSSTVSSRAAAGEAPESSSQETVTSAEAANGNAGPVTAVTSVPSTLQSNAGDQLAIIKQKLKQDYDTFVDQVGQLASLERQKNTLIQNFVQLCTAASLSTSATSSATAASLYAAAERIGRAGSTVSGAASTNATAANDVAGSSSGAVPSANSTTAAAEAINSSSVEIDHSYASSSPPA